MSTTSYQAAPPRVRDAKDIERIRPSQDRGFEPSTLGFGCSAPNGGSAPSSAWSSAGHRLPTFPFPTDSRRDRAARGPRGERGAAPRGRPSRRETRAGARHRRRRAAPGFVLGAGRSPDPAGAHPPAPFSTRAPGRRTGPTSSARARSRRAKQRTRRSAGASSADPAAASSRESLGPGEDSDTLQLLFDLEKPVVLGHSLAPAGRARFDPTGVDGDGEIRDRVIACLPRSVRDDGPVPILLRQAYGREGL